MCDVRINKITLHVAIVEYLHEDTLQNTLNSQNNYTREMSLIICTIILSFIYITKVQDVNEPYQICRYLRL